MSKTPPSRSGDFLIRQVVRRVALLSMGIGITIYVVHMMGIPNAGHGSLGRHMTYGVLGQHLLFTGMLMRHFAKVPEVSSGAIAEPARVREES